MRLIPALLLACLLTACGDGEPLTPPDALLPDGGRYRGTIVDGLLQGDGRIDYPNGSGYEGAFKNGQWDGHGRWHGATGDRYEGEFHQGLFHGQGRFTYAGGGVYNGQFQRGNFHGTGSYSDQDGHYQGEFENGLYHGQGTLQHLDGTTHTGIFVNGLPNGPGIRSDADGELSGIFVAGQLQGEGQFRGSNGERYSGAFSNGLFHGQGRYENANGDVWTGSFEQGELTGEGQFIGFDGTLYTGEFLHWRYHGQGHLQSPGGRNYLGQFQFGRFEGDGTLTLPDGTQLSGKWRDDRRTHDQHGEPLPDPLEIALLEQGRLLTQAIDALPLSTSAAELYSLTLGGDGQQSVFLREVDYVDALLAERFDAHGQIALVNHRDHLTDRPLATRENLARAIQALADRSGPEDLVFLYLTSHGSADHRLVLEQPRLSLDNLPAEALAHLMKPLAERNTIVVISACYSGGFIEPLKNEHTLVITAARADRVSFGCSEESDFTYFGRALFAEALHETQDIVEAFSLAKAKVAERELADHYQPSEPQIWAPDQVVERWRMMYPHTSAAID